MATPIERIKNVITIADKGNCISECNIDEIIRDIKMLLRNESLIPVICEDMYEYENPQTHERQSLHSYLVERVIDKFVRKGKNIELSEPELDSIVNEGYYGFSLLQARLGCDIYKELYNSVIGEENIYDGITLKKVVKEFLEESKFPLIITTCCFPILEKELTLCYKSYWCELETKNDKQLSDSCVYHLFGKAKFSNSNWGYNDKQLLRFLRSAYSSDYALSNLTAAIGRSNSRKTLLILGNDSPDWLFRFILSPIYGGDVYDDGIGYYISDEGRIEDESLNLFLREIKFEKESQLIEVLKSVTENIKNTNTIVPSNQNSEYDFFVAHAGDDKETAVKLVKELRNHGLKVWVDYENIKDGQYWQRIIDAIKKSSCFLPLITEVYIQKNKKKDKVQAALEQTGIREVSLCMEECVTLEKYLEGVQIELLLADKWLKEIKKDPYSIPVILKGAEIYGSPVTTSYIRNMSENSKWLPQNLFWGIQMYEFDENDAQSFALEWDRYKSK